MVKLARGGMNNSNRGRSKPRPLFPPGELPLFGPPPAYMRRPGPPIPPPPARGPIGYDYGPPPPPPMRLPPHLGPPMPPPPHMPLRGRPGRPPPPMPLLQAPVMPPRPLPFLRGRGMGPRMGPVKGINKPSNRRSRKKRHRRRTSPNKPEGEYYCEVCDRSWMTQDELDVHVSEHITCHFEGCSFTAAPKIVALHVKLQHDSGMFDKIVKSSNKEDIEKWREERRRNFPTMENIEKKLAERKEMEKRGERLEHDFKSSKRKQPMHCNGKGKADDKVFNNKRKRNKIKNVKNNPDNVKGFNPKFLSTASLTTDIGDTKNEEDYSISDEEWISDSKGVAESAPISNILMNLSSTYASDDESDSQQVSDKKEPEQGKALDDRCDESDDEPPQEEKIVRNGDTELNDEITSEQGKFTDRFSKRKKIHPKHHLKPKPKVMEWQPTLKKRPLTLLEKLLTKEIKQERNYILQCIRYIINENYFDSS